MKIMRNKKLLLIVLSLSLILVLVGCNNGEEVVETAPEDVDSTEVDLGEEVDFEEGYNEAPQLAERVEAGELPKVEDRLPKNPLVVPVEDEIGEYGGAINVPGFAADNLGVPGHILTETPIMFGPDMEDIQEAPNFVEEWEFSNEGKTLTFHLREGVKWSDGEPLTTDDFMFWWEDIIQNEELVPWIADWLRPGGELMEVVQIDDYTLEMNYEIPFYGVIDEWNSYWYRGVDIFLPRHYLEQYHVDYNPDVDELADEEGYDDWVQLFEEKNSGGFSNPKPVGRPVLSAWKVTQKTTSGEIYERNPYYFKVDSEGNQLPYIDRMRVIYTPDAEARRMAVISGDIDYLSSFLSLEDYPTLVANEEAGGYDAWIGDDLWASTVTFAVQQEPVDASDELAEILSDKRFRQALSVAIDREEMNELVFLDQGEPRQLTFSEPTALVYNEEWAESYAEYDPDQARELLDEMGLVDQTGDGWRDKPNGDRLIVNLLSNSGRAVHVSTAELAEGFWSDIGININHRTADEGTLHQQVWNGETHISTSLMTGSRPPWDQFMPSPMTNFGSGLWLDYYDIHSEEIFGNPDEVAVRPSDDMIEWYTWGRELLHVDEERQKELYVKLGDKIAEEILAIGTVGYPGHVGISNKGLGNVRRVGDNPSVAATRAAFLEQAYWQDEARRTE